jgi:hypothetical protein
MGVKLGLSDYGEKMYTVDPKRIFGPKREEDNTGLEKRA